MVNHPLSIVLIGAGNVGYHLGKQLKNCGLNIIQIFSRQAAKAQRLSNAIGAPYITDLSNIITDADLYIIAVNDGAIEEVASRLNLEKGLVVHTSGATPSTILQLYFKRFGIFYPLQTFSVARDIDFSSVPICVYANNPSDEALLHKIGEQISKKVYHINDQQRAILHIGAVFVNNFTNHLFQIAYNITKNEHLSFDLLRPLIQETAAKVQAHVPAEMQTGPAIRGDQQTIERHLQYLEKFPAYKALYQILTDSIKKDG
ncbi:MAG: Rossmann-like and DUF2520 domain-containing protein [Saprospiraceae bacterium]